MFRTHLAGSAVLGMGLLALPATGASAQSFTMSTVAGTGKAGYSGDGGPANAGELRNPSGVAVGPDASLYIADRKNRRIRKVDPHGTLSTIAGDGGPFDPTAMPLDGSAGAARFGGPYGVAVDSQSNVFVADQTGCRVYKVTSDGTIARFAGTGVRGPGGDGGPALEAQLAGPNDIDFDRDGNVYIADTGNHRIRMVDAGGKISTFAGTLSGGYSGDGGPAGAAQLKAPAAICYTEGSLFICDFGNHVVRKVASDGTITTIAGTGKPGFSGDGGPAASAKINQPCGVAVDKQGQVYIADSLNCRIRVVRSDGNIETVAGTGRMAYGGDGGPAKQGFINIPDLIDIDSQGNLYLAEYRNHVIRKLTKE